MKMKLEIAVEALEEIASSCNPDGYDRKRAIKALSAMEQVPESTPLETIRDCDPAYQAERYWWLKKDEPSVLPPANPNCSGAPGPCSCPCAGMCLCGHGYCWIKKT